MQKLIDCLIAAAATRASASILHLDGDFDILARQTSVRIESA